ncbi:hypothetical protein ACH5RR_032801 [Cinchona calisaya]|uniref:Uncharacterized protein n=1 Tax=Cinchona calisaya TaxID=153742 RepID=A0ABD2YJ38_9GENT
MISNFKEPLKEDPNLFSHSTAHKNMVQSFLIVAHTTHRGQTKTNLHKTSSVGSFELRSFPIKIDIFSEVLVSQIIFLDQREVETEFMQMQDEMENCPLELGV